MADTLNFDEEFDLLMRLDDMHSTTTLMPTLPNASAKEPKKRQKKPYTHSSYVCDKCRKSHRKCTHSRDDGKKVAVSNALAKTTQVIVPSQDAEIELPRRMSVIGTPMNDIHGAPIHFFIDNISSIFGFPLQSNVQMEFWRTVVPQLSHSYPLLRDGISGLCYLFDSCPRPYNLTPTDVLSLISNTFNGLQTSLQQFQKLHSTDKTVSLIVTSFLAAATFFGLGSVEALQSHIKGVRAILNTSWPELTATSSPARQLLLTSRPHLLLSEQTPIKLQHLELVEPLLCCMTQDELKQEKIIYGSTMHLLTLTHKAILSRESSTSISELGELQNADGRIEMDSSFRDICEYRVQQSNYQQESGARTSGFTPELCIAIKDVFECATFAKLKKNSGIRQHNQITNLNSDMATLTSSMAMVNLLEPKIVLSWGELVLRSIEMWIEEMNSSQIAGQDMGVTECRRTKSGGLMPWTSLDMFLTMKVDE